jgi:2-oxoglutarate dehydrogenase E2 component (dihydrolipoamide succinyltransferase)
VKQETAMLTTFNEVDLKPIKDLRTKYGEDFYAEHGVKLGFMGFFVLAAVQALKKFPVVNASIDGSDIVYHGYQDVGVAVSTDRGLVVPVIRDADNLRLADVEKSILDYSDKAKSGKLSIAEMQGGTFTISNGGVFGSLLSTPILNAPQTAILGMHTIQETNKHTQPNTPSSRQTNQDTNKRQNQTHKHQNTNASKRTNNKTWTNKQTNKRQLDRISKEAHNQ